MNKNNLLKYLVLLLLIPQLLYSGESGEEIPGEINETVSNLDKKKIDENLVEEAFDTKSLKELLKNKKAIELEPKSTEVKLPKNRLTHIFGQAFYEEINKEKIKIIKNCQPLSNIEKCYVVEPKKKSIHFNSYYFYTNIDNKVNAIIVFDKKKLSDVSRCKKKMNEWNAYFENFDIQRTTNENQSLSTFYTDNPHQKPLEIVASCYKEKFRDIESSFILKFHKHI